MFYTFPLPQGDAATLVLAVVFLIVFVVTYQALQKTKLMENPGAFVLAGCVALLSVLGLPRLTAVSPPMSSQDRVVAGDNGWIDFVLLPYGALAVALVLVILLAWLSRLLQQHGGRKAIAPGPRRSERIGAHTRIQKGDSPPAKHGSARVRRIRQ